ncbi:MAG: type II secretion system protein [Candidatus Pacebacteria bacterium]|nr:type II secretion system protein [Candidatus Paceibacterota bacterium]
MYHTIDTKKQKGSSAARFTLRGSRAFTLIELLVVISIIGLLSSVVLAALSTARKSARDAKRISEIREMQTALELYYTDFAEYPDGDGLGDGSWDTPGDGTFITALVSGGYLKAHILDPLVNDSAGNLRYYHFPAGTADCDPARGAFYVLGVADMETSDGVHPLSPAWTCPLRDFGEEMEFVIGKFEA